MKLYGAMSQAGRFRSLRQARRSWSTSPLGGWAIYRRKETLRASYVGLDPEGEETCDHVAFNADVKGSDGVLAIYPALQNQAPLEHILGSLRGTKTFALEQDGARCTLIGPRDHQLQTFRAAHPLYDRRLPALARIVSSHSPDASFIDVGANIGDSIALAQLAGANMPAITIDASVTYCKYLWANIQRSPGLFGELASSGDMSAPPGIKAASSLAQAPRARQIPDRQASSRARRLCG